MPKSTFYNIPEEKRERIRTEALKEFSTHAYSEVSINRIIKATDIPRGSFYQYFEDKRDLFVYVFSKSRKIIFDELEVVMDEAKGNVFVCADMLVTPFIECVEKEQFGLINIIAADPKTVDILWEIIGSEKEDSGGNTFASKIDKDIIKGDSDEDILNLLRLINIVLKTNVEKFLFFRNKVDVKKYEEEFRNQLGFLRKNFDKTYGQ